MTTFDSVAHNVLDLILMVCESKDLTISMINVERRCPELKSFFDGTNAFEQIERFQNIWVEHDGREQKVEVLWKAKEKCYAYYTEDTDWVEVPFNRLKRFKLRLDWLLHYLSDLSGIHAEVAPVCLVEKTLWELGYLSLLNHKVPLFFARRLADVENLDSCYEALSKRFGSKHGFIFTSTQKHPRYFTLPDQHKILSLYALFEVGTENFKIDTDRLCDLLPYSPVVEPIKETSAPLLQCIDMGSIIIINGNEYEFTGPQQKRCINYLYEQWLEGEQRINIASMFEDLDMRVSKNYRLKDLFKGNKHWKNIIGYEGQFCWLKIEKPE